MTSSLEISEFLKRYQKKLALSLTSQAVGQYRQIRLSRQTGDSFEAVDYFNVIRTSSVVIVGVQEARYINKLNLAEQTTLFKTLFQGPVSIIITSQGNALPMSAVRLCEQHDVSIFTSELTDAGLLDSTRHHLSYALAEHSDEHGVYIEVFSIGVLITGPSGVGKSELALALVAKGHRLISDDITRFSRISLDVIDGRSPDLLSDFMEVRGLGIVNIRAMFGANSLRKNKALRLIIKMNQLTRDNANQFDRLGDTVSTRNILGLDIPEINLPVAPGQNLAVIVEAAARNHLLNSNGYNAAEDFIKRQESAIQQNRPLTANIGGCHQ